MTLSTEIYRKDTGLNRHRYNSLCSVIPLWLVDLIIAIASMQADHLIPWSLWSMYGWLVGFLTSSLTTRLYRGRGPRQSVWQFYVRPHMRQSWETMTSVSAGHIILTPTQPVGSGRPLRESSPGPPHQESGALPTELPRPPSMYVIKISNDSMNLKTLFPIV